MTARVLVDTNILLYCYDFSDAVKQQYAQEAVAALASVGAGALSTQVLSEFCANATRKLRPPLTIGEARDRVAHLLDLWTVLQVTGPVILEATRGVRDHRLSFWDAQIWAAAFLHRIPVVFSEDFSEGAVLEGVHFVNPLHRGFRGADWL